MDKIFIVKQLGRITYETCPEMGSYPVRRMVLKEYGRWKYDEFMGTATLDDALLNLHEGDIISARLSFHVCKRKGKLEQQVSFHNLIK